MDADTLMEMDFDNKVWEILWAVIAGIAVAALIIGISVVTGGIGAAIAGTKFAAGAIAAITASTIVSASAGGIAVGLIAYNSMSLGNHYYLPVYTLSPEEIFKDELPIFNVNFFNPEANKNKYDKKYTETVDIEGKTLGEILHENGAIDLNNPSIGKYFYSIVEEKRDGQIKDTTYTYYWKDDEAVWKYTYKNTVMGYHTQNFEGQLYKNGEFYKSVDTEGYIGSELTDADVKNMFREIEENYNIMESEDLNFLKQYASGLNVIDVDTMEWTDSKGNKFNLTIKDGQKELTMHRNYINIATDLQSAVAKWYVRLRNLALVISMSILIYVGIRMMLTSIAAEKAKYKNMFVDWVVGVSLLFVMQYIMVFSVNLVSLFIELVDADSLQYIAMIEIPKDHEENIKTALNTDKYFYVQDGQQVYTENGNPILLWNTNLMGMARINAQLNKDTGLSYVGYVLVFLILVFYTVFFIFTYLKRVVYMAFLTIIAPMVAMTYPLDKLSDGKAQAFNMWLKEYIFNLIIQPFHLLLYAVLVGSAMDLAQQSVLYSLVALGFLMPAEKLLRKFFGFDKAQTPGFLGGAAGAALTMSAIGSLNKFAKGGKSRGEGGSSSEGKINYSRQKLPGNSFGGEFSPESMEGFEAVIGKGSEESSKVREAETAKADESKNTALQNVEDAKKEVDKLKNNVPQVVRDIANDADTGDTDINEPKGMGYGKALAYMAKESMRKSAARTISNIPSKLVRGSARFVGAGVLGGIGMAAAIASGDPNNLIKMGGAGIASGSALGAGLANRAGVDSLGKVSPEKADSIARAALGNKEYIRRQNEKIDRDFLKNPQMRSLYKGKFSKYIDVNNEKNVTAIMERSKLYKDKGITDESTIIELIKMERKYGGDNQILNGNEKILPYVEALAGQIKDINSPKDIDRVEKGLQNNNSLSQRQKDAIIQDLYDIKGFKRVK